MSILIKGIDMPKNGEITIAFASDENGENTMALIVDDKGKSVEHKGVTEIPAPHGRLIDADKLVWFIDNHIASGKKWVEFEIIKDMINSLPTIIEAEVNE